MMDEELIEISKEIFRNIIAELTLHMRFMDLALNRYTFVPDTMQFMCDGKFFHYSPITVIKTFQNDPNALTRGYLHVVFHSLLRHDWFSDNRKMGIWDLACDAAVENIILELDLSCTKTERDEEKRRALEKLKKKAEIMTAQRLYHVMEDMERDEIKLLSDLFAFDVHEKWYHLREVRGTGESLFGDETHDDPSAPTNNTFDKASHDTGERKEGQSDSSEEEQIELIRNAMKDWKKISEKIEEQLEEYRKNHGETEVIIQSLERLHREKYNYRRFLERFMTLGEKMKINDDEFDPILYTYGLQVYEDLPLIEPLETKEMRNVRELVIAIDTSGSVQGEVVQNFLQKTYDLFMQKENFFSRFHIHILQCDIEIRDAAIIRNAADFERYINHLELKGFGGTDFRPVFEYADQAIKDRVFHHLGGLIYFTDGDGIYPKKKPVYPMAFVFPDDEKMINVPPWAIRYRMGRGELHAY